MHKFKAVVKDDIPTNRLLSLNHEKGKPVLQTTKAGQQPFFVSDGDLKKDQEVTVSIKNDLIWNVEAGEDIQSGYSVEPKADGTVKKCANGGFGYVFEDVKKGELAKVIKKTHGVEGSRGQKGAKGNDGFPTEKQYKDIIARLEAIEQKLQEGE